MLAAKDTSLLNLYEFQGKRRSTYAKKTRMYDYETWKVDRGVTVHAHFFGLAYLPRVSWALLRKIPPPPPEIEDV